MMGWLDILQSVSIIVVAIAVVYNSATIGRLTRRSRHLKTDVIALWRAVKK